MADRAVRLWPPIAWAEGLMLLALAGVGLAVLSAWQACFLHCPPAGDSFGKESVPWLVFSGLALVGGIFIASWASGWSGARAPVQATVALGASVAALLLGGLASHWLVGEYIPAVVLAVGVAGIVAIRPSSARAVKTRLVVLAIFVGLALVFASVAALVILVALLTLPAMGAVESAIGS